MEIEKAEYDTLIALLSVAQCPACDGSGAYHDVYGDPVQCQWCFERDQIIEEAYNN
jgi:hypothetical protein